jgi:UDP-N-acetylmuramoyl-L-alanyl-D-glutamate--2,6-diaminopimelate ligase
MATRDDVEIWAYGMRQTSFDGLEKLSSRFKAIYFQEYTFGKNAYQCQLSIDGVNHSATIPVLGIFNLSNALAVISTLMVFGIPDALKRLSNLKPVLGRMEVIHSDRADTPLMVVDYAHTPDALQKVLETLKPIAQGRGGKLVCVFGCGGDRDQEKRPMMGAVAQSIADHVIITSDNPRFEDPQAIMDMIMAGIGSHHTSSIELIADRAAAIMTAVRQAQAHDVVLVAGKGHETTQEIQGKRFDFSDQAHLRLVSGGPV